MQTPWSLAGVAARYVIGVCSSIHAGAGARRRNRVCQLLKRVMQIAVIATGFFAIVATLLPLLRSDVWWIRMFDFPRAQIAVMGAASLAGYFYLQPDWGTAGPWFTGALVVCLVRLAYVMFPYTPLARQQVEQSRGSGVRWSLVCANVLMTNRDAQQLVKIISDADPDVILLVEADDWWQQQMRQFETSHRYIVHQPQPNTYGMLLYSRLELIDAKVHFLIQDDIPSIHARVKLSSGLEVELYCLHPRPPFPTEDDESTHRDAELLLVGKKIKGRDKPTVVCGDLNDVAWSRTNYLFQDISGLLDPRLGRGFFNTFHAGYPFFRFPLDHVFHSRDFRLVDFRRLGSFGSDHFPVYIQLSYESDASDEQEKLHATPEQKIEASETIEKAQS